MKDYIKLVRLPNLIFLAAIYVLLFFFVLEPVLGAYGIEPSMSSLELTLLILSTVFIAAGGYIINDYFDMRIDEINRPLTRIVGKRMTRKQAMTFYEIMTAIGAILGFVLCYLCSSVVYVFMYIMVIGMLWFYSSSYKRIFVLGNFAIAFLAALVPLFLALFETQFQILNSELIDEQYLIARDSTFYWMGGYAICAFLWTLLREIVKDMEDINGDRELECHTFAVVLGLSNTKILLYVLTVFAALVCAYLTSLVSDQLGGSSLIWRYYLMSVIVPSCFFVYMLSKSVSKVDFKTASSILKIMMAIGMLSSLVIYFEIGNL